MEPAAGAAAEEQEQEEAAETGGWCWTIELGASHVAVQDESAGTSVVLERVIGAMGGGSPRLH